MSDSFRPHGLQHARLSCLSPTPRIYSSQCTSPEHPVSCIESGLVIYFTYGNIHVSMLFFQIIPPLPSPTESKRLFYTSVSLLLSKRVIVTIFINSIYIVLVYCIGVFLSGLLPSVSTSLELIQMYSF